jgi:hypothetical protein
MTPSSHERYRDALTALADEAVILPIVSEAGERRCWWSARRQWRRTYGRFTPDSPPFARLVLVSAAPSEEICRIDLFERRPDAAADVYPVESGVGWASVARFPFDPDLPGLRPLAARASMVRYHPGRRCMFRTSVRGRPAFAKVYATDRGGRAYRDLVGLHRARLRGELKVTVAEPLAWDVSTRTFWQGALNGHPATEGLRGWQAEDLARRMGAAAASLTRASVTPCEVFDDAAALARSRRHASELVRRVPCLCDTVRTILDGLAAGHRRYPSRELRPIHRAPHPDQWLADGLELGLIDFDGFSRGDPEMDAGVVLGDLDALADPVVPQERLAAAFLAGCRDAGATLREPLIEVYRAHRQLAKALRAAQAIRSDGDRRAAKATARAERTLRGAGLI